MYIIIFTDYGIQIIILKNDFSTFSNSFFDDSLRCTATKKDKIHRIYLTAKLYQ